MKKISRTVAVIFAICVLSTVIGVSAFADSSGNFTATGTSATCTATPATFNSDTGDFLGATLSGGTTLSSFSASVQTPNGQGTTLLIRPSLDTGLFTETKLSTTINNATADAGIMVCVYVDPVLDSLGNVVSGQTGLKVSPTNCVVYDQRIQQVSNTLFSNLSTCISPAPGVPAPNCNFEILQTTLSAHSFDFVVPVANGNHKVVMQWGMIGSNTAGGTTASCVGPVSMTIQQVKNFNNSQPVSFNTN